MIGIIPFNDMSKCAKEHIANVCMYKNMHGNNVTHHSQDSGHYKRGRDKLKWKESFHLSVFYIKERIKASIIMFLLKFVIVLLGPWVFIIVL